MEKLFEIRVERKGNKLSFEAYRNLDEEPFVKHEVETKPGSCLEPLKALYDTMRTFEREVTDWIKKNSSLVP